MSILFSSCVACALAPGVFGTTIVGAGASVDVSAGQSPKSATVQPEATVISSLQLALALNTRSSIQDLTLRYAPRFLYRPDTFIQNRPQVFHQLRLVYAVTPRRTSRLGVKLGAALGEVEQGAVAEDAIGGSNVALTVPSVSLFGATAQAEWQERLSRITTFRSALSGGLRTSSRIPVFPGLDVSSARAVPTSYDAALALAARRRLSERFSIELPVTFGAFGADFVDEERSARSGPGAQISAALAGAYTADEAATLEASVGATHVLASPSARSGLSVFPSASFAFRDVFYSGRVERLTFKVEASHGGSVDPFQGEFRSALSFSAGTGYDYRSWSIALDARSSVVTDPDVFSNDSRSRFSAVLPVTHRLDESFRLRFGFRSSFRSKEWPEGPLDPAQVELLGFVNLTATASSGRGSSWVL